MKVVKTSGVAKVTLSMKEWEDIGRTAGWLKRVKSSINYPASVNYFLEVDGVPYELVVQIRITNIANDGIGNYEFWGARGFDRGRDYIEDFEIEDVEDISGRVLTPEEKEKLINYLDRDEAFTGKVQESVSPDDIRQSYEDTEAEATMEDRYFRSKP